MDEETIVAVEIQETDFGEKVVLDSPYEAKDYIKVLPWREYAEEVDEHGSLGDKAIDRGMDRENEAIGAVMEFDWSDDTATHASWEPQALGPESGAWTVDRESFEEVAEFLEFAGFTVKVPAGVEV